MRTITYIVSKAMVQRYLYNNQDNGAPQEYLLRSAHATIVILFYNEVQYV